MRVVRFAVLPIFRVVFFAVRPITLPPFFRPLPAVRKPLLARLKTCLSTVRAAEPMARPVRLLATVL